jgi:hypothetical protein
MIKIHLGASRIFGDLDRIPEGFVQVMGLAMHGRFESGAQYGELSAASNLFIWL